MKRSMLTAALLPVMLLMGAAAQAKAPGGWNEDFSQAVQQAKENYKPILVLFDRAGSPFEKEVATSSEFARLFGKVQTVFVEFGASGLRPEAENANRALVAKYKVTNTPYMVMIAADGETTVGPVPLQGSGDDVAKRVRQMLTDYEAKMAPDIRRKIDNTAHDNFWLTDFNLARARAAWEKKPILVLFTGSDWCGYCIRMNKDLLSKGKFQEFAKQELVAVYLDFPSRKPQSEEQKRLNLEMQKRFKVEGFPTIVMLAPDGTTEIDRIVGYGGDPEALIKRLRADAKKGRAMKIESRRPATPRR